MSYLEKRCPPQFKMEIVFLWHLIKSNFCDISVSVNATFTTDILKYVECWVEQIRHLWVFLRIQNFSSYWPKTDFIDGIFWGCLKNTIFQFCTFPLQERCIIWRKTTQKGKNGQICKKGTHPYLISDHRFQGF